MARPGPDQELVLSVLDRLIDREPRSSVEAEPGRSRRLAQLKESMKRDLEWLLNSKQAIVDLPENLDQLATSPLTYGLPDLASTSLSNDHDRAKLLRAIEDVIRRFEPRLSRVVVSPEEGREFDRSIRFRIDAMLAADPAPPEPVSYDSVLQLSTKAFLVQGG